MTRDLGKKLKNIGDGEYVARENFGLKSGLESLKTTVSRLARELADLSGNNAGQDNPNVSDSLSEMISDGSLHR